MGVNANYTTCTSTIHIFQGWSQVIAGEVISKLGAPQVGVPLLVSGLDDLRAGMTRGEPLLTTLAKSVGIGSFAQWVCEDAFGPPTLE